MNTYFSKSYIYIYLDHILEFGINTFITLPCMFRRLFHHPPKGLLLIFHLKCCVFMIRFRQLSLMFLPASWLCPGLIILLMPVHYFSSSSHSLPNAVFSSCMLLKITFVLRYRCMDLRVQDIFLQAYCRAFPLSPVLFNT